MLIRYKTDNIRVDIEMGEHGGPRVEERGLAPIVQLIVSSRFVSQKDLEIGDVTVDDTVNHSHVRDHEAFKDDELKTLFVFQTESLCELKGAWNLSFCFCLLNARKDTRHPLNIAQVGPWFTM